MKKPLALILSLLLPAAAAHATGGSGVFAYGNNSTLSGSEAIYDPLPGTDQYITAAQFKVYCLTGLTWSQIGSTPTTLAGYGITDAGNGYMTESVSAASATTLSSLGRRSYDQITLGTGSGSYTVARALSDSGARAGDEWFVNLLWPTSVNPTVTFTDAGSGGSLGSYAGTGAGGVSTLQFVYTGSAWVHFSKGELDTRNLGTGVQAAAAVALDTSGGLASHNSLAAYETASAIGSTIQAHSANLDSWSGLSPAGYATSLASTYVPQTTTVNGHALSGNVTVSASDITTGTLPHAQLPALASGDIPNNAANTSGSAGSVPITGVTGTASGFAAAAQNGVNTAGGHVVADANNQLPYDPRAANLENTYDVFEGDSITYGYGLSSPSTQSFAALFKNMNYAYGHSTVLDVGVPSATIPSGSNSGNNVTDHYSANVYPYRPWAGSPFPGTPGAVTGAAGRGTITGDGNITITFSSSLANASLAVGGTILFNGHLVQIATIPDSTHATIATSVPAGSGMATSLAGINPSLASWTFGGAGGRRANLHLMIGTNDLFAGNTSATVITNLTTYTTQAQSDGFTVILSTILPANRDTPPLGSVELARQAVNAAIRSGQVPCNQVADSAAILNTLNTTWYQSDLLHPTATGAALLAACYNAWATSGNYATKPFEGTSDAPLIAPFYQPFGLTPSTGAPVYYVYKDPSITANNAGIGIDASPSFDTEIFAGGNSGISFNGQGFQATGTTNRLAYLDSYGNFSIAGNLKAPANFFGSSFTAGLNSKNVVYGGGTVTVTLPASPSGGDTVQVSTQSGTLFTIAANTGQTIYGGSSTSTTSFSSLYPNQSVTLETVNTNTWQVTASSGPFSGLPGALSKITATLASGSATISNASILTTSAVTASHLGTSAGNAGALYVSALSSGSATIKSTNASDNDTIVVTVQ